MWLMCAQALQSLKTVFAASIELVLCFHHRLGSSYSWVFWALYPVPLICCIIPFVDTILCFLSLIPCNAQNKKNHLVLIIYNFTVNVKTGLCESSNLVYLQYCVGWLFYLFFFSTWALKSGYSGNRIICLVFLLFSLFWVRVSLHSSLGPWTCGFSP